MFTYVKIFIFIVFLYYVHIMNRFEMMKNQFYQDHTNWMYQNQFNQLVEYYKLLISSILK